MNDASDAALPLDGSPPRLTRVRLWGFYIALAGALLLLAVPMAPFLVIPFAWPFLAEELGAHQFHDVGVATLVWLLVIGLLAQFIRPKRQVGAMQQALLVFIMMVSLTAISRPATLAGPLLLPIALAFVAAALHPARAEVVRVKLRLDPFLAVIALLAAVPLVAYGRGQLLLDHSDLPLIAHGGHWTAMATVVGSIIVLAMLVATRPRGWRVPLWSVGGAGLLFGVASAALPHMPSSVGSTWGALAAAWAVVFVIVAEWRYRATPSA